MKTTTRTHNFFCIISVLALAGSALGAAIASSSMEERRPLRIAQCRELCYRQALAYPTPPALCRGRPDCFMCHDYCRVLAVAQLSLATSMCADRGFCSQGCRVACAYHRLRSYHEVATGNSVYKT
ncbi:uncharacterized protein LOC117892022 [Drosophila subobscura]|uniref:uncharacterized protein LOC117892022 n=1 Tax=Drosophila subobscura TaxID=7241 RepID=UPI00155B0E8D|nr:uncharacterized protein LOC117892022 [Drosophila subobscura]